MLATLAVLPWLLMVASLLFLVRRRPRLQDYPPLPASADGRLPSVSVVVPTQDDATRIGICLATLLGSDYPELEVLVVDHDSVDGTLEIVESLHQRTPGQLRLLRIGDVPEGQPWRAAACLLGAREATGELLLFTEPGTVHDPDLLGRAVAALKEESADLLTVQPRLTMQGFWERLVMPHVWLVLRARFPSARLVNRSRSPRNAMAYHQFMLFRREAYDAVGGHEVVRPGAVEDLAVPQAVATAGHRLFVVHGDAFLETRMFRTFTDLTADWPAAVPHASRTTVAPWASAVMPWIAAAAPTVMFVLPPLMMLAGLVLPGGAGLALWGLRASVLSLLFWLVIYTVHRIRPAYAIIYPVGAAVTAMIFVRSILRHDDERPAHQVPRVRDP